MTKIFYNQLGYRPTDRKIVNVVGAEQDRWILKNEEQEIVAQGVLSDEKCDEASNEKVSSIDLSEVKAGGAYQLEVDETSATIQIEKEPYKKAHIDLCRFFYFQRCGCALEEEYAGVFKHKECHTTLATLISDEKVKKDVTGGWHDAGDYGRYTVAATTALGHLLYAYEMYPEAFEDSLHIPESGNSLPDILNECRYELEWLLKMQKENGSVYHKVATRYFCGMVMPEDDLDELFLFDEGSCATAAFTAIMAMAARLYYEYDKAFSKELKKAALKGMEWLEENPAFLQFRNPPNVMSGEYGDGSDKDERMWAYAELYRLTKEKDYLEMMATYIDEVDTTHFGWGSVGGFAALAYLIERQFDDSEYSEIFKQRFTEEADAFVEMAENSAYETAMLPIDYRWGSNMTVLNRGVVLAVAYYFSNANKYKTYMMEQWNYVFGRNPLGVSYVTGLGTNAYSDPHHRPMVADGIEEAIPGFVSGGPNYGRQDQHVRSVFADDLPPAKAFADHFLSYSTNEITIYWNSPAVFLSAALA